jgi:hypothetical protein
MPSRSLAAQIWLGLLRRLRLAIASGRPADAGADSRAGDGTGVVFSPGR